MSLQIRKPFRAECQDGKLSVEWLREPVAPVEAGETLGTVTGEINGTPIVASLTASRAVDAAQPTPAPKPTEAPAMTGEAVPASADATPEGPRPTRGGGAVMPHTSAPRAAGEEGEGGGNGGKARMTHSCVYAVHANGCAVQKTREML